MTTTGVLVIGSFNIFPVSIRASAFIILLFNFISISHTISFLLNLLFIIANAVIIIKNATIPKHKTSLATKKRGLNLTKKSPFNPLVSGLKGRQKWSCAEVWLERGELFYSREYGMWGLREPPFYPEAPVVFLLWYSSKSVSQGQENRASRSWG